MRVSVDGAELFYSSRGRGYACLVPSAIGTKPYERQMPRQLSERLQLVFVDLRGGGESTGDPSALTFDRAAEDLEAVRVDLGLDRVAVIGHSIIGAVAIEYARRCPASVSHVITVGAPPRGDMEWLGAAAAQFFERDAAEERKAVLRDNMAKLPPGAPMEQAFLAQAPMRFFDPRVDMAPLYRDAVHSPRLLARLLGPLTKDWDVTANAGSLHVPLLLAHGRYDYTVPYALWEGIESTLPTATRQVFSRSGHQPFHEEPESFGAVVEEWMRHAGRSNRGDHAPR